MKPQSLLRYLTFLATACLSLAMGALPAHAVPSFARQTGLPCEQCHTSFPELTSFGRHFKAEGYTMTTTATVSGPNGVLELNATPPLSYMLQVGYTRTAKAQPDSVDSTHASQNGDILLPQELSLFYAGRISPMMGAFTQITYSMVDAGFAIDNTDIRAANKTQIGDNTLVYGLTINNNPTVQDLWNSTPAWGFPFAATEIAPGPSAAALLDGGLAQLVAGVGGYAAYYMDSGMLYGEYTLYRSAQVGNGQVPLDSSAPDAVIKNYAPYMRVAYERDFGNSSWEIGALSLNAKMVPGGNFVDTTPTDKYADTGLDTQLQLESGGNIYGVKGLYLKEKQTWGAASMGSTASNATDNLTTTRLTGSFTHQHNWGANVQLFSITGDSDTNLYGGAPDSAGEVVELNYTPWLNTRFSAQYTKYSKLDGASSGASDANTIYLLAWFMF
ncbi:MAG TPA: cytochrome C [bacterium]|nr:cytochrome C [bacterium]